MSVEKCLYLIHSLFNSAKLRARQKERLAKRDVTESSSPVQRSDGLVLIPHPPSSNLHEDNQTSMPLKSCGEEKHAVVDAEDNNSHYQTAVRNTMADSALKLGRISKQKYNFHPEFGRHLPELSRAYDQVQGNNLLPVIGLCAPNAPNKMEMHRKVPRSYRQFKQGLGLDFPLPTSCSASGPSNEISGKGNEAAASYMLSDLLPGTSQLPNKSDVPRYPPFNPVCNYLLCFLTLTCIFFSNFI